jgi:hypothetical protein
MLLSHQPVTLAILYYVRHGEFVQGPSLCTILEMCMRIKIEAEIGPGDLAARKVTLPPLTRRLACWWVD